MAGRSIYSNNNGRPELGRRNSISAWATRILIGTVLSISSVTCHPAEQQPVETSPQATVESRYNEMALREFAKKLDPAMQKMLFEVMDNNALLDNPTKEEIFGRIYRLLEFSSNKHGKKGPELVLEALSGGAYGESRGRVEIAESIVHSEFLSSEMIPHLIRFLNGSWNNQQYDNRLSAMAGIFNHPKMNAGLAMAISSGLAESGRETVVLSVLNSPRFGPEVHDAFIAIMENEGRGLIPFYYFLGKETISTVKINSIISEYPSELAHDLLELSTNPRFEPWMLDVVMDPLSKTDLASKSASKISSFNEALKSDRIGPLMSDRAVARKISQGIIASHDEDGVRRVLSVLERKDIEPWMLDVLVKYPVAIEDFGYALDNPHLASKMKDKDSFVKFCEDVSSIGGVGSILEEESFRPRMIGIIKQVTEKSKNPQVFLLSVESVFRNPDFKPHMFTPRFARALDETGTAVLEADGDRGVFPWRGGCGLGGCPAGPSGWQSFLESRLSIDQLEAAKIIAQHKLKDENLQEVDTVSSLGICLSVNAWRHLGSRGIARKLVKVYDKISSQSGKNAKYVIKALPLDSPHKLSDRFVSDLCSIVEPFVPKAGEDRFVDAALAFSSISSKPNGLNVLRTIIRNSGDSAFGALRSISHDIVGPKFPSESEFRAFSPAARAMFNTMHLRNEDGEKYVSCSLKLTPTILNNIVYISQKYGEGSPDVYDAYGEALHDPARMVQAQKREFIDKLAQSL